MNARHGGNAARCGIVLNDDSPSNLSPASLRIGIFGGVPLSIVQGLKLAEGISLDSDDTATLRAVYLLALGALRHTHVVDDQVMSRLADTTMEVYLSARDLRLPATTEQNEDLAVLSIEVLMEFHADTLNIKH